MSPAKYISHRLKEIYLDGYWIANTNLKDQLEDLTLEQARTSVHGLNSIARLVFHLNYYLEGIIQVLEGGALTIKDKYSFDLPELTSESSWQELKSECLNHAQKMVHLIGELSEEDLQSGFVDEKYGTYQRNLDGIVEHSYYHIGQIVIIKKMIQAPA